MSKQRIAVIVQSSRGYGRSLLAGIASFARAHRAWSIFHDDRILSDSLPDWLRQWRGDGMIACFENQALIDFVKRAGMPAVDLQCERQIPEIPIIRPEDSAATALAYQHFRELGLRRIGFCGFKGVRYSEARESHLVQRCEADGVPVAVMDSPFPHAKHTSRIEADGFLDQEALVAWLKTLELPIGIMACNDIRASQVLNAIRTCDFSVPDEIAVVGMDNDTCVCGLCEPALTSVDLNAVHIGFLAAESLHTLLEGGSLDFQVQTVEPAGIIVRESSNLYAVEDEEVAQALKFISENSSVGISVEDIVEQASISRSTLERRFTAMVGRSIKSEINRIRVLHLKELLTNTNYSLEKIARMVGFAHSEYMITFFKKAVGATPGDYRKEHRTLSDQP